MTLCRFSLPSTPAARASAGLALLALVGLGIAAASPEALVAGRFAAALEAAPSQTVADAGKDRRTLVSGSEAYWLAGKRRLDMSDGTIEPASWAAAPFAADLSVGDRITISSGKDEHVLEVVAVSESPTADAARAAAAPDARNVVVTLRDTSAPDGRVVTFSAPADPAPRARPARAL